MRVLLVGRAADRARLRAVLRGAGIEVAGEFVTLAEVESANATDAAVVVEVEDDGGYDEKLTRRELDVLELVTEGLSNKFIAERLGISDQTVKFHIASILGKLGAANRTDAVRRALRRGLIEL